MEHGYKHDFELKKGWRLALQAGTAIFQVGPPIHWHFENTRVSDYVPTTWRAGTMGHIEGKLPDSEVHFHLAIGYEWEKRLIDHHAFPSNSSYLGTITSSILQRGWPVALHKGGIEVGYDYKDLLQITFRMGFTSPGAIFTQGTSLEVKDFHLHLAHRSPPSFLSVTNYFENIWQWSAGYGVRF